MIPGEFEQVSTWINAFKEEPLRAKVIKPLLVALGYSDVFESHGTTEFGKDIVAWSLDTLGNRGNLAVVVKAQELKAGRAQTEVIKQVNQALSPGFKDPITGEERPIHKVLVVTNKRVKDITRDGIKRQLPPDRQDKIVIWDLEDLTQRWMQHFPLGVQEQLLSMQKRLADPDSPVDVDIHITKDQQRYSIRKRFPDSLTEEDLKISGNIAIPIAPENQAIIESLQEFFRTGKLVEIPGEFATMELPKAIRDPLEKLGISFPDVLETLSMGPAQDDRLFPMRAEFALDSGESLVLDYLEFRRIQAGAEQVTLSNAGQPIPIEVTQVIDFASKSGSFRITRDANPVSAHWHLRTLQVIDAMSRPGWLRLFDVQTGLEVSASRTGADNSHIVPEQEMEFAKKIARIESALRVPVMVPLGEWSAEDVRNVLAVDRLLESPVQSEENFKFQMNAEVETADVEKFLETMTTPATIVLVNNGSTSIFGNDYDLGRVQYVVSDTKIGNADEIRASVAEEAGNTTWIHLKLIGARAEIRYIRLGAPPFIDEEDDGQGQ